MYKKERSASKDKSHQSEVTLIKKRKENNNSGNGTKNTSYALKIWQDS